MSVKCIFYWDYFLSSLFFYWVYFLWVFFLLRLFLSLFFYWDYFLLSLFFYWDYFLLSVFFLLRLFLLSLFGLLLLLYFGIVNDTQMPSLLKNSQIEFLVQKDFFLHNVLKHMEKKNFLFLFFEIWSILYQIFLENWPRYNHKSPNYWVLPGFCSRLDQKASQKILRKLKKVSLKIIIWKYFRQ